LISARALGHFATEVFARAGMSRVHAALVAEVLVWADLRGVGSHGVMRIPRYVAWLESGDMNPRPEMRIATETAASVLLEADRAPGPVAMMEGVAHALRKARDAAIGLALVRGTTHTAALGYYTQAAARHGMAAIALSASAPNMAYHGARAAGVSTGPISIAVPGDREPLVLDMASALVPFGRLAQARRSGGTLPAGAALDCDGNPTTDPAKAEIPLPMGGPKGSGLALMIECLASLVAANPLVAPRLEGDPESRRHRQNGMVIAIDVAHFGDLDRFKGEVERLAGAIKALPPAAPGGEIMLPGERAGRALEKGIGEGIRLPRGVLAELSAVAARLGVERTWTPEEET
jgi:LDH2 family malate/lactate/ureidoglycolate dehydrogenase